MFLAVVPGLSGHLALALDFCANWERRNAKNLGVVLQLGDIPLRHDFRSIRGPRDRGLVRHEEVRAEDLFHRRAMLPIPLLCLAGEEDDPDVLDALLSRQRLIVRRPEGTRSDGASVDAVRENGLNEGLSLLRGRGSSSDEGHELRYLPSGSLAGICDGSEMIRVAGLSLFSGRVESGSPASGARRQVGSGSFRCRRSQARRVLAMAPGSIDVLISHDRPGLTSGGTTQGPEVSSSTSLFERALDSLHPMVALHGHGRDGPGLIRTGEATLVSLPPCRREALDLCIAVIDTSTWAIELLSA